MLQQLKNAKTNSPDGRGSMGKGVHLMTEYRIGNATVRIHPGKLTEEERKAEIVDATQKFLKSIWKQKKKSAKA